MEMALQRKACPLALDHSKAVLALSWVSSLHPTWEALSAQEEARWREVAH